MTSQRVVLFSVKNRLVLASASPRRLDLLKQIYIVPDAVIATDVDETPVKGEKPRACAERLAVAKALAVHKEGQLTLAADTIVACGVRMLPKSEDADAARGCLELLSGRRHHVYGGIALVLPDGKVVSRVVDTVVQFKRLTIEEIDLYLETGEWNGVAGGYAIQGYAAGFIKSLRGSYSNVVGLSLHETLSMLRGNGF